MSDRSNPRRQLLLAAALLVGSVVALPNETPTVTPGAKATPGKRLALPRVSRSHERLPMPTWLRHRQARVVEPQRQEVAVPQSGHNWDAVSLCESSGNWQDTDGMFEGGLQFLPSTWLAYGGGQYAQHAYDATREQQITVAERTLATQGIGAWPTCGWRLAS